MNRLPVVEHLPPAEIARRYRTCPGGAEKSRGQVIWLVTRPDHPVSAGRAARTVGRTPAWGRALLKRWNAHGPDGLADRRRDDGADPVLTPARQAELYAALQADPPDGGLWTGPKVARYVRDRWGAEVVPQTGWRWLVRLGFRPRGCRPRHPGAATPGQQRVWLRPPRRSGPRPPGRPPGQGRRGVGRGRGPGRTQADRPPGVVAQGTPPDR